MPELPEVEVTRLGLLDRLPGRQIVHVTSSAKQLRSPIPRKLLGTSLPGHTILTVDRRAKYLLFRLSGGSTMVIHLGMTGKLGIIPSRTPPASHDHLRLRLDDGMELRFNDARRFGEIMFWPPDEAREREQEFSARLGVEPFSAGFSAAFLQQCSRSRCMPVKNLLMDSRIIAGIGNIYANEILFAASLHPQLPANAVSPEQWRIVVAATRKILRDAIRAGGSTISDFLGSSGNPGYFQVKFKVYGRAGAPCKRCGGLVVKIPLGGRATFFCPRCQPLEME